MNVTLTNILQWAGRHVIWCLTLILILASTVTMNNSMLSLFLLTALQKFEDICHVSTTIFFSFWGNVSGFPIPFSFFIPLIYHATFPLIHGSGFLSSHSVFFCQFLFQNVTLTTQYNASWEFDWCKTQR